MVSIGKIDPDYDKELIMVTWIDTHWKNTKEQVSWSKICLNSDKKHRGCKKRKRLQMAYRTK